MGALKSQMPFAGHHRCIAIGLEHFSERHNALVHLAGIINRTELVWCLHVGHRADACEMIVDTCEQHCARRRACWGHIELSHG